MDNSFVSIGETIQTVSARNKQLGFLYDGNQATFAIDSDSTPRLIHLKITRAPGGNSWVASIENETLGQIAKYYIKPGQTGYDAGKYDPPRMVSALGKDSPNHLQYEPEWENVTYNDMPGLQKVRYRGPAGGGDVISPFRFYFQMYDVRVETGGTVEYPTELRMEGEQRFRGHEFKEVGTYIIPICYHRTTDAGFEAVQVLRSDASFWPAPNATAWSIQDNWQDLWRYPDRNFAPDNWWIPNYGGAP